jgi:O-antigen/teichoic acid export membrane protein
MIWQRARQVWSMRRLTPFETATPEGRAKERYRRVALTAVSGGLAKGLTFFTQLVSIPLVVRYLGAERYGLWITITSVVILLGFADLGIGIGVLNAVSEAYGRNDRSAARTYVSNGFFLLLGIALLGSLLFAIAYPSVPWSRVFNVASPEATREAGPAIAVLVACFALNLPLVIVQRVQLGYQEGFITNLWQAGGSLVALVALLLAIWQTAGVPWLVLAMVGVPVLASAGNWLHTFRGSRRWLAPSWKLVQLPASLRLARIGSLFFVFQFAGALAFGSDNLIASQVLGAPAAARYSIAHRLFMVAPFLVGLVTLPLWPAYGEAAARGDRLWIRRTLFRSLGLGLAAATVAAVVLTLFADPIFALWVGPALVPPVALCVGLAIWSVIYTFGSTVSVLLNAAGVISFQVITAVLVAISSVVLRIVWSHEMGISAIAWGLVAAYAAFSLIPTSFYLARRLRRDW